MPTISDITNALESWAPRATQQSYDNSGLQVGDASRTLTKAIIALDLTPAVLQEAITNEAELIITHHPLIFRPVKSITTSDWNGSLILQLAQSGIALYCIHTNLDAAKDGVSFALAEQIGLQDISFLQPLDDTLYKLVTFVPKEHFDVVREAIAEAGAGEIGDYTDCAFAIQGTGYFQPGIDTNPHIGEAGGALESVNEIRLEAEVLRWRLSNVLSALHAAHPYEEVAYDVYPLANKGTQVGMGAIGTLKQAESLPEFIQRISGALNTTSLRYVGDDQQSIQRVAVCGGAGSDLIGTAIRAGADAYLTADITYHRFFEALSANGKPHMALIDAMHYETEACTENLLQDWLSRRFASVEWIKTATRTSPIKTLE